MLSIIDQAFIQQSALTTRLQNSGSFGQYMAEHQVVPADLRVPSKRNGYVGCVDEGIRTDICLAGSGILLGADTTVRQLAPLTPTVITSHAHCGACRIYAATHGIDTQDPDQLGIDFAEGVANRLGIPNIHLPADKLFRHPDHHHAMALYYSAVAGVDPSQSPQMPDGYTVSRFAHPNNLSALAEVKKIFGIASGPHSYGDRIIPQYPFVLIPIGRAGDPSLSCNNLHEELTTITNQFLGRAIVLPGVDF